VLSSPLYFILSKRPCFSHLSFSFFNRKPPHSFALFLSRKVKVNDINPRGSARVEPEVCEQ
jgi:hypothetical protein